MRCVAFPRTLCLMAMILCFAGCVSLKEDAPLEAATPWPLGARQEGARVHPIGEVEPGKEPDVEADAPPEEEGVLVPARNDDAENHDQATPSAGTVPGALPGRERSK